MGVTVLFRSRVRQLGESTKRKYRKSYVLATENRDVVFAKNFPLSAFLSNSSDSDQNFSKEKESVLKGLKKKLHVMKCFLAQGDSHRLQRASLPDPRFLF